MLFGGETAQSYYEEGLTAAMKGDLDQAIRYFERAYELDADLYSAQHQIGRCLLRQGKADSAIPKLTLAAHNLPVLAAPQLDLGYALLQLNRFEEARNAFSAVLRDYPEDPRAILGLAYIAYFKEEWNTSMNLAMRVIELGRTQFDAHFLLARAADQAGMLDISAMHYQHAVTLLDRSIEAAPNQAAGYYLRSRVHERVGQYARAVEDADKALLYADDKRRYFAYNETFSKADILILKGRMLEKLARLEEAKKAGLDALLLAPGNQAATTLAEIVVPVPRTQERV